MLNDCVGAICVEVNGKEITKGFYRLDFIPNHNIPGVDIPLVVFMSKISQSCNRSQPTKVQLSKNNIRKLAGYCHRTVKAVKAGLQNFINQGVLFHEKDDIYIVNHFVLGMGSYKMIEKWKLKFRKKDGVWYYNYDEVKDR